MEFCGQQAVNMHWYGDQRERRTIAPAASGSRLARARVRAARSAERRRQSTNADQQIDDKQRHLVAAEHDAGGDDAGGDAVDDRPARQRPLQAHHGDRQVGEAQHLADVLDAPGHGGAVAEGKRGDQTAGPMPALVAEPQHQGRAAERTPWPAPSHRPPTGWARS